MKKSKGRLLKALVGAALALTIVSAGTMIKPIGDVLGDLSVSVGAVEPVGPTDFTENTNMQWALSSDGTLTISVKETGGNTAMPDYTTSSNTPWSSNKSNIKTVIIRDGVTYIGNFSFNGFKSLKNVEIPSTVTSIGKSVFKDCTSLEYVNIFCDTTADTTTNAIKNCNVTTIGSGAFNNTALTKVTIPATVSDMQYEDDKNVGWGVFNNCTKLTTLVVEKGVTNIGVSAFSSCTNLNSITLPGSVTTLGNRAFFNCHDPLTITIGTDDSPATRETVRLTTNPNLFAKTKASGFPTDEDTSNRLVTVTQDGLSDDEIIEYFHTFENVTVNNLHLVTVYFNNTDKKEVLVEHNTYMNEVTINDWPFTIQKWYTDPSLTPESEYRDPIISNMTLYAGDELSFHDYKFVYDFTNETATGYDLETGAPIGEPIKIHRENNQWFDENGNPMMPYISFEQTEPVVKRSRTSFTGFDLLDLELVFALNPEDEDSVYISTIGFEVTVTVPGEGTYNGVFCSDADAYSARYTLTLKVPAGSTVEYTWFYTTSDGNTYSQTQE